MKPVATVEKMPGTTGFGLAVFRCSEVPIGTDLYTVMPAVVEEIKGRAIPSVESLWHEYRKYKDKWDQQEKALIAGNKARTKVEISLGNMSRAMDCRMVEICACLKLGGWDLYGINGMSPWCGTLLKPEHVAYLVANFRKTA